MRAASGVLAGLVLVALLVVFVLVVGTSQRAADVPETDSPVIPARAASGTSAPAITGNVAAGEPTNSTPPIAAPPAEAPRTLGTSDPLLATVTGRVVDFASAPLSGIEVELSPEDFVPRGAAESADPLRASVSSRDVTADDGSFRLAQSAGDKLVLSLKRPDGTGEFAGEITVLPGVTLDLGEITLRAPRPIAGRVQDPAGRPIAGADVLVSDGGSFLRAVSWRTSTPLAAVLRDGVLPDEDWIQSFAGALQQCVRTTSAADGSFHAAAMTTRNTGLFVAAGAAGWSIQWITPTADPRETPLVLTLQPATSRVAGRVTCADNGAVPAGTLVEAKATPAGGGPSFGRAALVARDGSFEIAGLLDAPQRLVASAPDHAPSAPVLVAPGTRDARLLLGEPTAITLHVRRDGQPVDAFEVLVDSRPPWALDDAPHREHRQAGPHAAGTLHLSGLPLGRVTLQAVVDGECSDAVPIDLDAGSPSREVELDLGPARTVRGRVTDRVSGVALAGAEIRVHGTGAASHVRTDVTSGADGEFVAGPLPDGPLELRVKAPAHVTADVPVPVDPAAPLVVALERGTLVRIRVGPVLAAALAHGEVVADDTHDDVRVVAADGSRGASYRLGFDGVLLDDLVPGGYRVELLATGNPQPRTFSAVAGELVTVDY